MGPLYFEMEPTKPLSITARVEIAVGCLVVVVFIASLALWVATCFKARAIRQQLKLFNTIKGSSQSIYDDISVSTNDEMVPSNQATHVEDQQQGVHSSVSLEQNPAYRSRQEMLLWGTKLFSLMFSWQYYFWFWHWTYEYFCHKSSIQCFNFMWTS